MDRTLEVLFTPADFAALKQRDLSRATCVVFDILRATTSMLTALRHGAAAIFPVSEIAEALVVRAKNPEVLLAGEREGVRILASQTGGVDFDLGNSPREFIPERVRGRTIVITTTNGTRALQAASGASRVYVGSFHNLSALGRRLERDLPGHLLLICAGTYEETAYEDVLAAGALAEVLWEFYRNGHVTDGAQVARQIYRLHREDLVGGMTFSRNAQCLLGRADLRDDVAVCLQRDVTDLTPEFRGGRIDQPG